MCPAGLYPQVLEPLLRYAILGDIHANLPALEAVLDELDTIGYDVLMSVGDLVGYNPWPLECVQIVMEKCDHVVVGNHDYGLIGRLNIDYFNTVAFEAIQWTEEQLPVSHFEFFENLPLIVKTEHCGIVHSTLAAPQEFRYLFPDDSPEQAFEKQDRPVFFYGHTHYPVAFFKGESPEDVDPENIPISNRYQTLINVGSVGQPRDGIPDAAVALYDTDTQSVEVRRVEYDVQKTADKIKEVGLPDILAERLFLGQ